MRRLAQRNQVIRHIATGVLAGLLVTTAPILTDTHSSAWAQVTTSFSRIDVAGNQRIEGDTIRSIAGIPTGKPVSPAELNAAIQSLFASGLFQNVDLIPQAGRLVIEVEENPTINLINFEGNTQVRDDLLERLIELQPRRAFSVAAAEADALRIVDAYRAEGRFSAEVKPVIIERDNNRVDLVFEIIEGRVTEVQRISFVGNKSFSDSRLRRAIETGEAGVLSGFFSNDTYDQDRVQLDRQLLRQFYLDRGHVDFQVRSVVSELSRERDGFFLSFNVSEGPVYTFGDLTVTSSASEVDASLYQGNIDVRSGQTYNASKVEDIIERIAFKLADDGVPFVDVAPRVVKNDQNRTIDIEFEVIRTPKVFVERIDIEGNSQTLDRVIRRQFNLVENDPLNRREISKAESKIRALGLFDTVSVRLREGSASNRAIIDVDVSEKPTGAISFGVGYSTDSGFNGSVSFSESNLLGRGQSLSAQLSIAQNARVVSLSFDEPSFLDRDLLAGFDIYYREVDRDESSYQLTNIGIEPRIAFPVSEDARLQVSYRLSHDEIRDLDANASALIVPRSDLTSALEFTYTLDKRNSPVDPTGGYRLRLSQEFAGLGGDVTYSKTSASAKAFTSFFGEDLIVSAEVEGGALTSDSGDSRITDRFFLGGDTLRGFEVGGIGPRDVCNSCGAAGGAVDDALGGNLYAVGRVEASFPLGLPEEYGIFGGVFFDTGSVWNLDSTAGSSGTVDDSKIWRSAAGVSLFWSTPIGPLRFNFSRPIQQESFDKREDFRISIDTRF